VAKTLTIFLAADVSKLNRQLKTAETGIGGFANKIDKLIGPALIGASAAFGAFAVKIAGEAISAASDLGETQNKVGVIFGESSRQILAFAENASTALGQTKQQALDGAATFAQFGKAAGLTGGDLVDFSSQLVTLSADLASFSNTTPEQAITALGSALRGEAEPIRNYGVLLDDATLKAEALELGIYEGTGALTQQQKVLAAQSSILKQTADAQGDFAATSDGLANSQRILSAAVENAKASIGVGLVNAIQAATKAMGGSGGIANTIEDSGEIVGTFTIGVGVLTGELLKLASQLDNVGKESASETRSIEALARGIIIATGPVGQLGSSLVTMALSLGAAEEQTAAAAEATRLLEAGYRRASGATIDLANDTLELSGALSTVSGKPSNALYTVLGQLNKGAVQSNYSLDRFDKTVQSTGRSATGTATSLKELNKDIQETSPAYDAATKRVQLATDALDAETRSLENATQKRKDYVNSLVGQITAGFDLGAGFAMKDGTVDGAAWVAGVEGQLAQTEWFGNVLEAVKRSDATNGEALAQYLAKQGIDKGAVWGQALLDQGLVPTMAAKLQQAVDSAALVATAMADPFTEAGDLAALNTIDGLSKTLNDEKAALRKIGKNIGKPIGARIKEEIAQAVSEAITAAAAARTAALAEVTAREAAQNAIAVEQATAQSLARLIRNSDNRAGRNVQPVLA
jgi:hypothetical protein